MKQVGEHYHYVCEGEEQSVPINKVIEVTEGKYGRSAAISLARSILAVQPSTAVRLILKSKCNWEDIDYSVRSCAVGGEQRYEIIYDER